MMMVPWGFGVRRLAAAFQYALGVVGRGTTRIEKRWQATALQRGSLPDCCRDRNHPRPVIHRLFLYRNTMRYWKDKIVLVTGGSSGLGRVIAEGFGGAGARS